MARYRRDVEVAPFPRELLDQVVRALLDAAEEAPITERGFEFGDDLITDVRLVEGRHLSAGARYHGEEDELTIEMHVPAWNRAGDSQIEVTAVSDGHTINLHLHITMSGGRLRSVRINGDYQGLKPFRTLRRARWEAEIHAEEWWPTPNHKTRPLSLRVTHPFASADVGIARRKDKHGRWCVRTTAKFGGRSLLRPIAAIWLASKRARILRKLDEGLATAVSAWNTEVPGMAKRGMRQRLDFEHQVSLKAVPREWAETYLAELHQGIERLSFVRHRLSKSPDSTYDVRLLKGKHIRPGTKYRVTFLAEERPLDLHVAAWDLNGPNRIEFTTPDASRTGWVEIDSASGPTTARAGFTGTVAGDMPATATAEAHPQHLWTGGRLLTATAQNPIGEATLTAERVAAPDGEWTIAITAAVEGQAWARHLIAVAGILSGPALKQSFRETADAYAEKWNIALTDPAPAHETAAATLTTLLDH